MSTFGSLLVQDHIVGVSEIEQALQRQVIYGGDLATNLLELGIASEAVLTDYMAKSMGLSPLVTDLVAGADPEAIKKIPWTVATTNEFIPVRIDGDRLVVAVSAPIKEETVQELSFLLGFDFDQFFVFGFRLAMARNRYYGIPMPARFSSLQERLAPNFKADLPPLVASPSTKKELLERSDLSEKSSGDDGAIEDSPRSDHGDVESKVEIESIVESALADRDLDSTVRIFTPIKKSKKADDVKLLEVPKAFRNDVPESLVSEEKKEEEPKAKEPEASVEPGVTVDPKTIPSELPPLFTKEVSRRRRQSEQAGPPFDLSHAMDEMAEAKDRDAVIDLIMKHGVRAFDFVVFFVVHGTNAQGRSAAWLDNRTDSIEHLSIPLNQGGMFQTVHDTRSCHLGPLGTSEIEERVIKALGRPWPKNCAILPVTLRNRVVSIVYGDSGASGVQSDTITDFSRLSQSVAEAFERILLKRKVGKDGTPVTKPVSEAPIKTPVESTREEPAAEPAAEPTSDSTSTESKKMDSWVPGAREPESIGRYSVVPEKSDEPTGQPVDDEAKGVRSKRPSRPADPVEKERDESSDGSKAQPHRKIVDVKKSTPPPKLHREVIEIRQDVKPSSTPGAYYSTTPEIETGSDIVEGTTAAVLKHLDERTQDSRAKGKPGGQEKTKAQSTQVRTGAILNVTEASKRPDPSDALRSTSTTYVKTEERKRAKKLDEVAGTVTTSRVVSIGENRRSRSVVVEMKEEIDRLVERILAPGRFDETAADLLLGIGDDALVKIISKFPGPLLCDRYQQVGRLQRVGRHGPLLQTLLKFEKKAVPYLLRIFESPDSDVRFYATFMFSELIYPEAIEALTSRLFDNDRQIRALAIDVIRGFKKYPEYNWAMQQVIDVLDAPKSGLEAKIIAAEALGQLRVSTSVAALIQMLASVDTKLVERCHRALVRITFNDFGFTVPKWTVWHDENRMRHRAEWAIDSIVHPKESLRNAAISEVTEFVGDVEDWSHGPMDHKERLELQRKLREWWGKEGRALFPSPGNE